MAGNELLLLLVWLLRGHCLGFNSVSCGQVPLELQGQFFSVSVFGLRGAFTSGPANLADIATHVPKSSVGADLMREMTAAGLRSRAQQVGAWLSGVRPGFPGVFSFWWGEGSVRLHIGIVTASTLYSEWCPKWGTTHSSTTSANMQRSPLRARRWKSFHPSSARVMCVVFTRGPLTNSSFWHINHSTFTSRMFLWQYCEPQGKRVRTAAKGKESPEEKMFQSGIFPSC